MAARWMQSKTEKIKRDSIARSRGVNPTFAKTERDAPAPIERPDGFMVMLDGTAFHRDLPRTFGPFATEDEARAYIRRSRCDGAIKPIGKAAPRATPTGKIPDGRGLDYLVAEHTAMRASAREVARATREALGKRNTFPWGR